MREQVLVQAVALGERSLQAEPQEPDHQSILFHACNELGIMHAQRDEVDQAESAWKRAQAVAAKLAHDHPALGDYQGNLALVANNLGILWHFHRHRPAEALPYYQQALEVKEQLVRDYLETAPYWSSLWQTYANLRELLIEARRLDEALSLNRRIMGCWEQGRPSEKPDGLVGDTLWRLHRDRGDTLLRLNRPAEALTGYDRALELCPEGSKPGLRQERTIAEAFRLVAVGDHARGAALVRGMAQAAPGKGDVLYAAAWVLARAALATQGDSKPASTAKAGNPPLMQPTSPPEPPKGHSPEQSSVAPIPAAGEGNRRGSKPGLPGSSADLRHW
jgi:tetratricopeptide (TPR) repeat protein